MFKRIVSSLIIFSLLWIDVVKAMDDEEEKTPPLTRHSPLPFKRASSEPSPKEFIDTTISHPLTEKSSLLVNGTGEGYQSTKLAIVPSSNGHSVNGHTKELTIVLTNGHKNPKKHIRVESSFSDEEDRKSTDKVDSLGEIEFKLKTKHSRCCCCWGGSSSKDVESGIEDDLSQIGSERPLLFIKEGPTLTELKKQALLSFVALVEEDSKISKKKSKRDLISLEEQPLDEEELLAQKARFLFSKIQGTSLEDFGRWFQGHVLENRYRWQDWAVIGLALGMAAGTGAAMSPIVEWSIYNSFLAHHLNEYRPFIGPLADYINGSTGLIALTDAFFFMLDATSPSTMSFTTSKSVREKRADRILISLALIPGIYLELLHFQIAQAQKKVSNTTGWWNPPDRYFYFSALGFFPYLVAQSWKSMRPAVSKIFHPTVPEHVKDRVMALRQLDARLNYLSHDTLDELYDLLKNPLFAPNSKFTAWGLYLRQGEVADLSKIEGLLSYLSLTKYAQESLQEELEQEEGGQKKRVASRVLAGLGLPAGFSLITISVFGVLSAFMDWRAALALSITAAACGFAPEAFLQSHNVQETLEDIGATTLGKKKNLAETLKDPCAWGRGTAKVLGTIWAFLQNSLTNLLPIFVSLAMLIPEQLGGSDTTQTIMTGVMITLVIPYLISELLSGTHDVWGHVVSITFAVQDFFSGVYERILSCCGQEIKISPNRQKREIRRILKKSIETTLRFTSEHVRELDTFERRIEGKEAFD